MGGVLKLYTSGYNYLFIFIICNVIFKSQCIKSFTRTTFSCLRHVLPNRFFPLTFYAFLTTLFRAKFS